MQRNPRLDELLVTRGFFANTHDAQAAVLAGEVVVGEHRETSAGRRLKPDAQIRVKASAAFASRGGEKLAKALRVFDVEVQGKNCIDLGASTGGFTDCLLKAGARRVVAVDVGEPLMRWELQQDARVDYRYETDVRGLDPLECGGPFDIAVADLSFISLTRVMEDLVGLLEEGGLFVSLIKPQFEASKDQVGEGGIVRDRFVHEATIASVLEASEQCGLHVEGLDFSPITGTKGNIEFLYVAVKQTGKAELREKDGNATITCARIASVVTCAHDQLVR